MKKILLIGHGPAITPSSTHVGFPQLRTWSILKYLRDLGHDVHTVYAKGEKTTLPHQKFDAAVTAGPFSSAFAALSLHDDIPLWLDWPSDPRADLHARIHGKGEPPPPAEQAFVTMLHTLALRRADAIGVISKRQYWATLSSLMDWTLSTESLQHKIHYTPISFDFPFPKAQREKQKKRNITLAGSMNSWFDAEKTQTILLEALRNHPDIHINIYGGRVAHHIDPHCPIHHWKHPHVHHHGWLSNDHFYESLCTQDVGLWVNHQGVEPLLGSRTRALLFAWMGMDIAASCDTELMESLLQEGLVWDLRSPKDLQLCLQSPKFHGEALIEYCQEDFSPTKVFSPIKEWLKNPVRNQSSQQETMSDELHRLRTTIRNIHNSKTWRWGSRIHRYMKTFTQLL